MIVAASVVERGACVSLMPRYTVSRQYFPQLVLVPLRAPKLGRHIDILARPEAMERTAVQNVVRARHGVMAELIDAGALPAPIR